MCIYENVCVCIESVCAYMNMHVYTYMYVHI
jgi:hypothetical protein